MTRGPLPAEAIRKAMKTAEGRGTVMEREFFQKSRLAFILFCAGLTVFVRVRRSRRRLMDPGECAAEYRADVLHFRRVPPWGTWQFFRILDDRIIEVRSNGTPVLQEGTGASAPAMGDSLPPTVPMTDPVMQSGSGIGDPQC